MDTPQKPLTNSATIPVVHPATIYYDPEQLDETEHRTFRTSYIGSARLKKPVGIPFWDWYYAEHPELPDHRSMVPDLVQPGATEYQEAVLAGATSSAELVAERRKAGFPDQASVTGLASERYKVERKRQQTADRVKKHRERKAEQETEQ